MKKFFALTMVLLSSILAFADSLHPLTYGIRGQVNLVGKKLPTDQSPNCGIVATINFRQEMMASIAIYPPLPVQYVTVATVQEQLRGACASVRFNSLPIKYDFKDADKTFDQKRNLMIYRGRGIDSAGNRYYAVFTDLSVSNISPYKYFFAQFLITNEQSRPLRSYYELKK